MPAEKTTDYTHASGLLQNTYGLILLEPFNFEPGELNKGFGYQVLGSEPEFYGKKLLEEVIRAEGSPNHDTPVWVLLDSLVTAPHNYTQKDYLQAGANMVFDKYRDDPFSLVDRIKAQQLF